jgi:hypothetical protein
MAITVLGTDENYDSSDFMFGVKGFNVALFPASISCPQANSCDDDHI